MSKWKTALHTIKRSFMCCIRCTDIVDRMTRTATEEMRDNENTSHEDRKTSVAKIVITNADNHEEHIEFTQPISIQYMGQVHIHNETRNYYTPNPTPNLSRRSSINEDKFSLPINIEKRIGRRTLASNEGEYLKMILAQQSDIHMSQLVNSPRI